MIFDSVIQTERLILRCLDSNDAEHLFCLRSDPEYAESFGWKPYTSVEQAYERIRRVRDDSSCYAFSVVPKTAGNAVGGVCLWNIDYESKTAELGYDLEKEQRWKGYALEACDAVVRFAFEELKMKTVTAFPRITNQQSIKLLQKLGFERRGIIKSKMDSGEESEHYDYTTKFPAHYAKLPD